MKLSTTLALAVLALISVPALGQRKCATDQVMKNVFQSDPQAKLRYETTRRLIDQKVDQYLSRTQQLRTTAIITIPVVVHIAISNPALVTDQIVQNQIDTLNRYYGAAPGGADSLRVYTPFRTAYGRSQIRFCLAKRTPDGQSTTGITRRTTAAKFEADANHPSSTIPAWNTTKYLNIWVVDFTDNTLGYSFLPGAFAPGDQRAGFVVGFRYFGAGGSYLNSRYNAGKTAVHEIGHYFDLLHPWGDDLNPNCAPGDGFSDTPPTDEPTDGCPSGPVPSNCSAATSGVM